MKILLSPDAAGGASEVDPMTQSAAAINTDFPLIRAGKLRMVIKSPEKAISKTTQSDMLVFRLVTQEDTTSTEGVKLHAGYGFTKRIMLTPTGDRTKSQVAADVAMWIKAVEGPKSTTSPAAIVANPNLLADKPVDVLVQERKGSGDYGPSNDAKPIIPKG